MYETQYKKLLDYFANTSRSITRIQSTKKPLYVMNLWARIGELKLMGHRFSTHWEKNKNSRGRHMIYTYLGDHKGNIYTYTNKGVEVYVKGKN